jgi:glycosyltransferase involved in cell wall biosynthesis
MTVSAEVFSPAKPALMASYQQVTLVHDYLNGMRGGEKVLELLCRMFPQASIFTLMHVDGSVAPVIEDRNIITSPLQHMPWAAKKYRLYFPLFPAFAEFTKAGDCDLVISTSHAVAKSMVSRKGGKPRHVCYIHSPMRYIWDRFDDYFGPEKVGKIASRLVFRPIAAGLQRYDRGTTDRVDVFVANSRFVADRVKRLYGREAEVVAPPVDIGRFDSLHRQPEDWYLVVSALVPYKRVDHAIAACAALRKPLKIVGSGPDMKPLRALAARLGADVEFLGFVSDNDLGLYYSRARALLFPGIEDFGIVPVEAIASGCPVIALQEGGILDSMTSGTAVFYQHGTVDGLKRAIGEFEWRSFDPSELRDHARRFSEDAFVSGFQDVLIRAIQAP